MRHGRKALLGAHLMRQVSVESMADPRTVRKVMLGTPVSAMVQERILRALMARGLMHLVCAASADRLRSVETRGKP